MISVNNLTVEFVGKTLFDSINFNVEKGNRIGLVGRNGAGKSTLLKILSNLEEASSGNVVKLPGIKVGLLKQDLDFVDGSTVFQEAEKAFKELKELEKKVEKINEQLASRTDYESEEYLDLIHDLNDLNDRIHISGLSNLDGEIEKVLKGLGFNREDFDKQTSTFSGGWRMRVELAKLLLSKPEVLLLDEPTNHLDIESIIWLEKFLKDYPGAIVLVSHDKMFLNNVCNQTIEISLGKIFNYKANYSKYLELREERYQKQIQAKANQDKEIKHTEQLIEKFRYKSSKAAFAQTLIKKLEKTDRIEIEGFEDSSMSVKFVVGNPSGKVVFKGEKLGKSYGDNNVFSDLDLMIERGEKIAFVGQNGQGKTTLARILMGDLAYDGKLEMGHNIDVGYFAQNQSNRLNEDITVLESMENAADQNSRPKVRDILGSFLFSGEDVDKKVKVLSGGERGRLALALMLLRPHNVLIMDEPTNHLDINSKNVLKEALVKYDGTVIVVSHDRDFLEGLTNKVLEFKDGKIKEFLGDLSFYLEQRQIEDMRMLELSNSEKEKSEIKKDSKSKNDWAINKEYKKLKNQLLKIEKEILSLEKSIENDDDILNEEGGYEKIIERDGSFDYYNSKKEKLDNLMLEWESLSEEIETYEKN